MLHGYARSIKKLSLVLFLFLNLNCKILYDGKDEIEGTRLLYPTAYHPQWKKNNFQFVHKAEKNNWGKTLFVIIEIQNPPSQNPSSQNDIMKAYLEEFNKELKKKLQEVMGSKSEAHILSLSANFTDVKSPQEGKVLEEVKEIKSRIIEKKYENNFTDVVAKVVYTGSMQAVAQTMIKNLTDQKTSQNEKVEYRYEVKEFCFNPSEKLLASEKVSIDEKWKNTHLKNFYTVQDENLLQQLTLFLCQKDEKKFQSLKGRTTKEDFVAEIKKIDFTHQDEDVRKILEFLENKQNKFLCYISEDLKSFFLESAEEVAKKNVNDCID
ncbi:MAG: hypothetical protein LBD32_02065 [Cytophagales bacterium]|jgi:hypothetical protein|nr:hypothetical protein [Cytophagales bacterium]